jgi:hypothetical protein
LEPAAFATTLDNLKSFLAAEPSGNRWFKVNLHTHGLGHDAAQFVDYARCAEIDVVAVTDHQSFGAVAAIQAAASSPGRVLIVLPGIEITAREGAHILAIFPSTQTNVDRQAFLGFLEIAGTGDTSEASRKSVSEIFNKVHELGGVIVIPHPFTGNIGLLASARKMSTKLEWLDSGHIELMQIPDSQVSYVGHDQGGEWMNRFVLASARPGDIAESNYCLAPFNRSDAHKPDELADGCSWFRMESPTVEGLKQVACEPRTRISRTPPAAGAHDCILGVRITGGYCHGQVFRFNERLTCIVGQNYSGKSAVLDFIRFAMGHDKQLTEDSKTRLLQRLNGILKPDGKVELYLRHGGQIFVIVRLFSPVSSGYGPSLRIDGVSTDARVYHFNVADDVLDPVSDFDMPIECYEQGRISRLREDLGRQLEMLDEFAGVSNLKAERSRIVLELKSSAETLAPLYEEREDLRSGIAKYEDLRRELDEKSAFLPVTDEDAKWVRSLAIADSLDAIVTALEAGAQILESYRTHHNTTEIGGLFSQSVPKIPEDGLAQDQTLNDWAREISDVLKQIESARCDILRAVNGLRARCRSARESWNGALARHHSALADRMRAAGVDSPKELLSHIESLRRHVTQIEKVKRPRLEAVNAAIAEAECARARLLTELATTVQQMTLRRTNKAADLTTAIGGKVQVFVDAASDREHYRTVLSQLVDRVTASGDRRIRNRDEQISLLVDSITPLQLANALLQGGTLGLDEGATSTLVEHCGITPNTSEVLCDIAGDIKLLNKLQTTPIPDVPRILVQRQGENEYVALSEGLSPGEQSAAILSLALGARSAPLIIDQPEDELGYSYVVHLIVPKLLEAKANRQVIIVTHNANIPVLGDSDYVIQMRNLPSEDGARRCQMEANGCFENPAVTHALIELEGGRQAFQFRRHRYRLHK